MSNPKFQHDCDSCEYLGTFFDLDVYLCRGSILARFGDDPPDYYSSPLCVLPDQLGNRGHLIGLGEDRPPMPFQDYLFSDHASDYHKAWVLALALRQLKQRD